MSYQQTIYNLLRQAGMTEAGAIGFVANGMSESGCEPNRLEGDYSSLRTLSKEYTEKVMSGAISRDQFARDGKGYGIWQQTYYTRKYEFYDFWKAYGGRLDNVTMQTEFALKELRRDFIPDWRLLCSTDNLYEATKAVCLRFENPAVKNTGARYAIALRLKSELQLGNWEKTEVVVPTNPVDPTTEQPTEHYEQIPATEYWPPRMLCEGMDGKDVVALRGLLYARGWTDIVDEDYFDRGLTETVKAFQRAYNLDVDGIVGPQTWGKLLERGE